MKNFISFFIFLLFCFKPAWAFNYTDEDKNMFYDAFIEGYITEMKKNIEKTKATQKQKSDFIESLKADINKQDLIDSSWNCIQKYPIEQIVAASVICTYDWTAKQNDRNKNLYKILK